MLLMADQEASLSTKELAEEGATASVGQSRDTIHPQPSAASRSGPQSVCEGETSTTGGGGDHKVSRGTKVTFREKSSEEARLNEDCDLQFVGRNAGWSIEEEDDNVNLDVDFDEHKDWDREDQQTLRTEGEEVPHGSFLPSTRPGNLGEVTNLLGKAAARLVARSTTDTRKTDVRVSGFLIEQLRNLAAKERELEARLRRERVEHVVGKIEEEVEAEGVIEEMWLRMRADEEAHEMECRERDFEMERREVQLEEEAGLLQAKVRRLEDELKVAHAEKEYALQKKQDEMDDVIQNLLVEMRNGGDELSGDGEEVLKKMPGQMLVAAAKGRRAAVSPSKAIFLAFEDMLKEADERAEQDRNVIKSSLHAKEDVENTLQQEQRRAHERERQLESKLLNMEKEVSRLSGVLREAEMALSVELERRKESRLEADGMLENWREEKKLRGESEDKVKRLYSFLTKIRDKLANEEDGKADAPDSLQALVKDLDKELQRTSAKRMNTKRVRAVESEQATRWKAQRDLVEAERDKLEEKLKLHVRRARDREAEIEAMWLEREKNLATKCSHLEADVSHLEAKYKKREFELMQDRKLWEKELEGYRKEWADEKAGWEAIVSQREDWLEEQVAKWASLLEDKDRELLSLKGAHLELNDFAKANKQRLVHVQQVVYDNQKTLLDHSSPTSVSCESYKAARNSEDSEGESIISSEKVVRDHDKEYVRNDEEKELDAEKFRLERQELEKKVMDTLNLMEELRTDFQIKTKQTETETKKMETALSSKSSELEQIREQLNSREREMEALMQKFRDEVLKIDREVEKERKEREEVMEMHFAGKRRLVAEMREKEESWQNEMDSLTQELLELRELVRQKHEDILTLKDDLHDVADALEKQQKAREVAETEIQKLEEENVILLEELSAERRRHGTDGTIGSLKSWRDVKLQAEVGGHLAGVDKQTADVMSGIETLREEVRVEEAELVKAKTDREAKWEKRENALAQEHQEVLNMKEQQWQREWHEKEQALIQEKEHLQEEAAVIRGAVQELEWLVKHGQLDSKAKLVELPRKDGLVKVHTSHLEEVDQYILDLQMKVEDSEKKRKSAEVALAVQDLKKAASFNASLVQFDREGRVMPNLVVRHDGSPSSHLSLENGVNSLRIRTRSSAADRSTRTSFSSTRELMPDTCWELEHPTRSVALKFALTDSSSLILR